MWYHIILLGLYIFSIFYFWILRVVVDNSKCFQHFFMLDNIGCFLEQIIKIVWLLNPLFSANLIPLWSHWHIKPLFFVSSSSFLIIAFLLNFSIYIILGLPFFYLMGPRSSTNFNCLLEEVKWVVKDLHRLNWEVMDVSIKPLNHVISIKGEYMFSELF